MSAQDRDVVAFIERQQLGFIYGSAVAHIVDAARENDPELRRASLRRAKSFLDFEDIPEELTAPAMGAPVTEAKHPWRKKLEGKSQKADVKPAKAGKAKMGRPRKVVSDENGETPRKLSAGAHMYRCGTCGEMKHATAFYDGQREQCTRCRNAARTEAA